MACGWQEFLIKSIIAEEVANELICEEEMENQKAEKKKQKKKRQAERKRLAKLQQAKVSQENRSLQDSSSDDQNSDIVNFEEEEVLDPNCAFVSGAVNAVTKQVLIKEAKIEKPEDSQRAPLTPNHEKALISARRGNLQALDGHFESAIKYFTVAIKIQSADHRLYGNRSYCHQQIGSYQEALDDAVMAIKLQPSVLKHHYRKGLALLGLKKYEEAELAFEKMLTLDENCNEAKEELFAIMVNRIKELGFDEDMAYLAALQHENTKDAIEDLLNNRVCTELLSQIYISDEEDEYVTVLKTSSSKKATEVSGNGPVIRTLWVGNIACNVTEKDLITLFSKHAEIESVHILKQRLFNNKMSAFVNCKTVTGAINVMEHLQGHLFHGNQLKIRYPDNVPRPADSSHELPKSETKTVGSKPVVLSNPAPVNGECLYWRKLGKCRHSDDKCKFKHIKEHKGIDAASI